MGDLREKEISVVRVGLGFMVEGLGFGMKGLGRGIQELGYRRRTRGDTRAGLQEGFTLHSITQYHTVPSWPAGGYCVTLHILCKVTPVILHGVVSGACRMTGVTLHSLIANL